MKLARWLNVGLVVLLIGSPLLVLAQEANRSNMTDKTYAADDSPGTIKDEVDQLNAQVKEKENRIKNLDASIGSYQARIKAQEDAAASLQNQSALLQNRIEEKQLGIERTKQQLEITALEIQGLSDRIRIEENTIARRSLVLSQLMRQIQQADQVSEFDAFLARPSLSEFFARVEEIKRIEQEVLAATKNVKKNREDLAAKKKDQEDRQVALQIKKVELQREQDALEQDRGAKQSLLIETQNQEDGFQRVLHELRQQQQSEADDIAALRDKLKEKLDSSDEALARGDLLLNWPIQATRGISAHFHDLTYPFRQLFEHPGIDLPAPVGTPVRAAAGGYVAWNRTGKQYGNYVMLVHPGGIATVYAHLSRFAAKPDTYVERGEIIGYSGGRPGDQGAGLSTGPHLHFEVRQNGVPVNAEPYLPSL